MILKVVGSVVALLLLAVISAGLLWNASEEHYRGCVEAHLVSGAGATSPPELDPTGQRITNDVLTHASIRGCHHSPF